MIRKVIAVIFIILAFQIIAFADNINVYINGELQNSKLEPVIQNNVVYVKARELAGLFNAQVSWQHSIKTLVISDGKNLVKMMLDNQYIQVNNKTIKSKGSLKLIAGHTYIPVEDIAQCFGFYIIKRMEIFI